MGSGGGGANQVQKQEVTTTNLPKYLEPYVTDIASRAQAESNREYTPYEGRISTALRLIWLRRLALGR